MQCGLGLRLCAALIWGSKRWGWEEQENPGWGLSAWLKANVCKCVVGGGGRGIPHAWLCPCLSVRVSLSVCESLQQMPPPFLADHLTPSSPGFLPECLGRVGGGEGMGERVG